MFDSSFRTKYYKFKLLLLLILITAASCSKDKEDIIPDSELSEYEFDVIDYFK